MAIEENVFGNLPTDLILEIFSRFPSKSIARFRCLSKQWSSTLGAPYFTELFLTQSKTRPRLLFTILGEEEWYLYSCPQPHISYENSKSSFSVTVEFHMSFPQRRTLNISIPIPTLIYCPNMLAYNTLMLCNPSTRRLFYLPQLTKVVRTYFGYDPIDKQNIVLAFSHPLPTDFDFPSRYQILKLESGRVSWRSLDCPLHHQPFARNICINGILYYTAHVGLDFPRKIVCFNVNSAEFMFIDEPCSSWHEFEYFLVNFKGKLGGITREWEDSGTKFELSLWVLEDIKKQNWSKHVYILPFVWNTTFRQVSFTVGVTARGEIVVYLSDITHPFYVHFFNIEKNILWKVEIKGLERFKFRSNLQCCVDYVEDLKELI